MIGNREPKLVVIVGETATGKSELAMEVAKRFNGEIISADSWQVYSGLDIGTDKPSPVERAQIPHHLIDTRDPDEGFSAAVYKNLANRAITDIASRGKLPVMVGGTGLYVDSVLFDFSFLPPGDPEVRQELAKITILDLLALISQQGIDMTGIDARNKRRLVRLLETGGKRPTASPKLRPNTLVIGVRLPRGKLRQKIEDRVEGMFRRGLKHEVQRLFEQYGWDVEALKGVGYREFRLFFEGKQSLNQTKRRIIKSTLELAKRQRTWFKRNPGIQWVENQKDAIELVEDFLNT